MMNPDGVIHGHYRTSLSGNDLNRRWKKINKVIKLIILFILFRKYIQLYIKLKN